MELKRQGRWLVHEFDSLWDFTDSLLRYRYVEPDRDDKMRYIDMARHGWDEELPAAFETVESVVAKLVSDRLIDPAFQAAYDVAGAAVDVGRFVSGEPECMISYPLTATAVKPVITIVTSMSLGGVSRAEVLAQGRAVAALVRAIEATGHKVELWSDNVTTFGGRWLVHPRCKMHTVKVLLKGANDVLDPGQMIFALANYGMGRDLGDTIFPRIDGRVNKEMEISWQRLPGQGTGPDNPCPDLYPEGALLLPSPRSIYMEQFFGGRAPLEWRWDEGGQDLPTGDWYVPPEYVQASADFVIKYMRKLGLIAEQ